MILCSSGAFRKPPIQAAGARQGRGPGVGCVCYHRRVKKIRSLVFFGTHELAVPALEQLAELELTPQLVVTHPRAGYAPGDSDSRPHPVLDWSRRHGVDFVRSRRAAEPELRERIAGLEPDLLVVVDYGHPLPAELLEAVACSAIEVHPSLLPDLRGAHALRAALAAGMGTSGVTVFEVSEEPWGGPVLLQEKIEIDDRETFDELLPRGAELSCKLLSEALRKLDRSKKKPSGKPQKDSKSSVPAPRIGGRHRKAPWSLEAERVYDRLRAYSTAGLKAYFHYRPVEIVSGIPMEWVEAPWGASGTYLGMRQGKLAIICGGSTIFGIGRLRWPGGEVQGASEFALAERLVVGDRFA